MDEIDHEAQEDSKNSEWKAAREAEHRTRDELTEALRAALAAKINMLLLHVSIMEGQGLRTRSKYDEIQYLKRKWENPASLAWAALETGWWKRNFG